jgi:hypothetical protein
MIVQSMQSRRRLLTVVAASPLLDYGRPPVVGLELELEARAVAREVIVDG